MIQTKFDPSKPIRFVMYGRMSSDQQNPRSPDQQYDEIQRTLKRNNLSWVPCGTFRDDGLSGRKMSNRPSFMQMMDAIKSGRLNVDAILVDSFERFGRMSDVDAVRQNLATKFGVLVLTADSNFTDPTSVSGKALGFVESFRATQDAHVKAHNVLRGKRDIVRQKYWPGGPTPLGYKLESLTRECDGRTEIIGSRLVIDPQWAPVVREIFDMADILGLGSNRITQTLNKRTDLVQKARAGRFHSDTINRILANPIYKGVMVFGRVATDIVDDRKVTVRNAADEHFIVDNFCEPLVTAEQWERVKKVRDERGACIKRLRGRSKSNKQFQALAPGLILKFPLTGLVRCGICGASMRPNQGGGVKSKRGRRYVYYMCPNHHHGSCTNALYCPEDWLRESVLGALRTRLFPALGSHCEVPAWFPELVAEVESCLEELALSKQTNARPALEQELKDIDSRIKGWTLSFADPNLSAAMRSVIVEQSNLASERREQIVRELTQIDSAKDTVTRELNPKRVIECLHQLAAVMAGSNPTQLNHELSRHIDRIEVFPDRRVEMRTCRLGVFEGLDFVLSKSSNNREHAVNAQVDQSTGVHRIKPRLRVKLNVESSALSGTSSISSRRIEDPEQFADFDERWFWKDSFQMPDNRCWSDENAEEVNRVRTEQGLSLAKLSKRFKVSIPTIRRALRISAGHTARAQQSGTTADV